MGSVSNTGHAADMSECRPGIAGEEADVCHMPSATDDDVLIGMSSCYAAAHSTAMPDSVPSFLDAALPHWGLPDAVPKKVMKMVSTIARSGLNLTAVEYESEDKLVEQYNKQPCTIYAALVFESGDSDVQLTNGLPEDLKYYIRMNGTYLPSSSKSEMVRRDQCRVSDSRMCDTHKYMLSGFLAMEGAIAKAAAASAFPTTCNSTGLWWTGTQQQGLPPYKNSFASPNFMLFAAVYMVWAFAPLLHTMLLHLIHEKESLIKDCMLLMGLRESVYWISWLITYATMSAITAGVMVVAARLTTLLRHSSMIAVFLTIYPYTLSLVAMAFAMSAVFSKVQTAGAVGALLMIIGSVGIIPINIFNLGTIACAFLALFSPIGLAMAVDVIIRAEGSGEGISMATFYSRSIGVDPGDRLSPLSVGAIVYIIALLILVKLAQPHLNLEKVSLQPETDSLCRTPDMGTPCTSYYTERDEDEKQLAYVTSGTIAVEKLVERILSEFQFSEVSRFPASGAANVDMEPVGEAVHKKAAVVLRNLRKVFPRNQRPWWKLWSGWLDARNRVSATRKDYQSVAVKGLTLTMYEGQCFAFLGHSGSGKSSVLNMLAGLSTPTSGEAFIYGNRLSHGGQWLQSLVGVCPERNISVDWLTVEEQLRFFAAIKGCRLSSRGPRTVEGGRLSPNPASGLKAADGVAATIIREMGLDDDAGKPAASLSLAGKRKLSLAIAMIGDPQVILIDEPTRGLDPITRKQVWDILLRRRAGRVIIITSQSMDEADLVADRKAILSHGVLKCCGSSYFLRNRFGLSYLLHVTKGPTFNSSAVLGLIHRNLPDAVLFPTDRRQAHATFRLPMGKLAETARMITDLTGKAQELGVEGGALEATTLEEVFMQFQDEEEEEAGSLALTYGGNRLGDWSGTPGYFNMDHGEGEQLLGVRDDFVADKRPHPSFLKQTTALVPMKLRVYRRNCGVVFNTFGIAVVFALIGFLIHAGFRVPRPSTVDLLDSSLGSKVPLFYSVEQPLQSADARQLLDTLGSNHESMSRLTLANRFSGDEGYFWAIGGPRAPVGIVFNDVRVAECVNNYTVIYQPWHVHQLARVVATIDNAFFKLLASNLTSADHMITKTLTPRGRPLPWEDVNDLVAYLVSALVVVGLILVAPILAAQVLCEKEVGLRPILHLSGLRGSAYWASTYVVDMVMFALCGGIIILMGWVFGRPPFIHGALPALAAVFLFGCSAMVLMSYTLSFGFFNSQCAAFTLSIIYVIIGIIPYFWVIVFTEGLNMITHGLLVFLDPPYAFLTGIHFVTRTQQFLRAENGAAPSPDVPSIEYFLWPNLVSMSIAGMLASSVALTIALSLLQGSLHNPEPKDESLRDIWALDGPTDDTRDDELKKEKERVKEHVEMWERAGMIDTSETEDRDLILCYNLWKVDNPNSSCLGSSSELSPSGTAGIRRLWLGVSRGEIVVLLGGDKAGKSTVMQCLTGMMQLSYGDAIVNGHSVRYSFALNPASALGYCPQDEVLFGSLTVKEHLELYATIKGVQEPIGLVVEDAIQGMGLTDAAGRKVSDCSVQVQRKLSIAIAMMGRPPVILLDEPTKGMDLASRRVLWSRISQQSMHRATLISTHSVEEAEALGTRVGILVDGELRCLGSPQQLKRRFGSAYTLLVSARSDRLQAIREFIVTLFPPTSALQEDDDYVPGMTTGGIQLEEELLGNEIGVLANGQARFRVPVSGLSSLAMLLHELEANRITLGIEDYSVSQPTLQQVFYRLSRGRGEVRHESGEPWRGSVFGGRSSVR
ncbi:hypothetical protein CBR_g29620 [Chara braunii]|uniref:ABC transporter domain-containing protein n=1 Tax=Chara braunii TaxID=69332 RepID=A0A388LB19_CHABU|nr:hypothetical protein CBR_g29620 [Chara braunii]|eukprot:GBG79474.1 hypothetical protein CBR_g29620 [Chara braunii]